MNKKYGVIVGGSWGTANVKILTENKNLINWYVRNEDNVNYLREFKKNPHYLTSVIFDVKKLNISSSIKEVVENSDIIILAIPSPFLESELMKVKSLLKEKIIFSALKGFVPESHLIVSEHLNKFYEVSLSKIGIITGPCHAEEFAFDKLSYLTVACQADQIGKDMKIVFRIKNNQSKALQRYYGDRICRHA